MTQLPSAHPSPMTSRVEDGRTLVLERLFRAPPERVFAAFSQAEHLRRWWGPRGWEMPVCTLDFRPGGRWHYGMKCTDPAQGQFYGMESWGLGVYREIGDGARIVYTDSFSDAQGGVNAAMPSTLVELTFTAQGGGTRVVNRSTYASEEGLKTVLDMGMLQGISETWDRLDEDLGAVQT